MNRNMQVRYHSTNPATDAGVTDASRYSRDRTKTAVFLPPSFEYVTRTLYPL